MNDSEELSRSERNRYEWRTAMRVAAFPMVLGLPDLLLAVQRLPNIGRLYRVETALMVLNGITALIAIVAVISRRSWRYLAFAVWLLAGTIRLLTVGNLR